ncbi:MAG TPA: portal protein, partial [Ignavibacteriaceae bacterium]
MDTDAIIASALDVIADECTLPNEGGEILQIRSSDENVQKILYNLFYDILNIEFNLWSWTRNMCKYGDFYLKLEISEKFGVYNVIPFTPYHIIREEGFDPANPTLVKYTYNPVPQSAPGGQGMITMPTQQSDKITFDNFEMAHFRLVGDFNYLPYGRSYLEPARKVYKQLVLMEDAMLIHRIVRAPEKRIFYVNVGNIHPNEVENYMQRMISKMKKAPYLDPNTGQYNLKYNIQNMLEDIFIPVRGNDISTKIDTAKGLEYNGIEDVSYLRDKLFAALRIPKAFLGFEKDLTGKATLAAEDIRFARTISRVQKILVSELTKIALVHLYSQGFTDESMVNFELTLTNPSIIYDQERIALWKEKVEL